jgi:transposase
MDTTMASDPNAPSPRVQVITSVQRRRRWSTAEKVRLVEEAMQQGSSVSFVARHYGISPSLLLRSRRRMLEGRHEAVGADEEVVATSRVRELEKRVRDLERLLGRKTVAAPSACSYQHNRGKRRFHLSPARRSAAASLRSDQCPPAWTALLLVFPRGMPIGCRES